MSQLQHLRGQVIMFDGPDYVGKTTQLKRVKAYLEDHDLSVFNARMNGGTPIGEDLRKVLLSPLKRPVMSELYINLAQQYALAEVLQAERAKHSVVLIDRSPLSIIAYQVYGGGLDKTKGYQAADEAVTLHRPDLIICYQAPEKVLAARRHHGGHEIDYFELKPDSYFSQVNEGYQDAAVRYKAVVINAGGSVEDVHAATMAVLSKGV